jgi:hypothetical protein
MLALICANASSLPVYLAALDGNRSDKKSLLEIAPAYLKQFEDSDEKPYIIADSALYSEDNLQALSAVKWSGKGMVLPSSPPLRTVRESFPSYSSSLSFALCRTRFLNR